MRLLHPDWLDWPQTKRLIAAFDKQGVMLRFVGGCVRDALLGLPVQDVDAATPLLPGQTMTLLEQAGIKAIPTGLAHGTATAVMDAKSFEITTLRKDVDCDGRYAEVAYTDDWKEDAARRDFTFNALYLSPSGELFDYFDGENDLQAGRVRFIGDPVLRIREDYLRILRFFRFFARFGKQTPDVVTLEACAAAAEHLTSISGERIQAEMLKLLAYDAFAALQLMRTYRLLAPSLGFSISDCEMFRRWQEIATVTGLSVPPLVKLLGFVLKAEIAQGAALEQICMRLRLSNHDEKILRFLFQHRQDLHVNLPEASQKHYIRLWGCDNFQWALLVNWAFKNDPITMDHPYVAMHALATQWQPPEFPLGGDDLIAQGIAPGRELGQLLRQLEEIWEKSDYAMDKRQLLEQAMIRK